ncbi:MAG: NAD(+)/NADH kinase [Syntrophales bacterium]|jgi:NAD+ kinase|nr:NAD(+)/NADH kinase [Syntrophales bacterium]
MGIKKIGIIANIDKERSDEYTIQLRDWLLVRGFKVYLEKHTARKVGKRDGMDRRHLASVVDLIIAFGGDGTILRLAHFIRGIEIPIVGLNMGGFGYLTEVNLSEMFCSLERILSGNFEMEKRMMLDVAIKGQDAEIEEQAVLNDVVIGRGHLSRMVELEVFVNDAFLTTFKADGIIVSTPTGSTAYSLSAGGPIVYPKMACMVISPLCPHTLTNRPIILPADVVVTAKLITREPGAMVTLDGQISYDLKTGDTVTVCRSPYVTNLISSPLRDYWEILRSKLGWGRLPGGSTNNKPC